MAYLNGQEILSIVKVEAMPITAVLKVGMNLKGKTLLFNTNTNIPMAQQSMIIITSHKTGVQKDYIGVVSNGVGYVNASASEGAAEPIFIDKFANDTGEWLKSEYTFPDDADIIIESITTPNFWNTYMKLGLSLDNYLDPNSINPVENKVITKRLESVNKNLSKEITNLKSIVYDTVASVEEDSEEFVEIEPIPSEVDSKPLINNTLSQIGKIEGNSVVANQYSEIQTKSETITNGITWSITNGTLTMNGTSVDDVYTAFEYIPLIPNHKYLMSNHHLMLYASIGETQYALGQDDQNDYSIVTCEAVGVYGYQLDIRNGVSVNKTQKLMVIDLTQYFGSNANIPADLLANANLWTKYIKNLDYSTGTLVNNFIKTITAKSQIWDEEWELGFYDITNGEPITSSDYIRSKNYLKLIPNNKCYFKAPINIAMCFYDYNKNYLSYVSEHNASITIPSNAYYGRFYIIDASYGTTYNNDVSIYYGETNRGYIKYQEEQKTINGILKGTPSTHDYIYFEEQEDGTFNKVKVTNVDTLELETFQDWSYDAELGYWYTTGTNKSPDAKPYQDYMINQKGYSRVSYNNDGQWVIFTTDGVNTPSGSVNYELATPTTEVLETGLTLDDVAMIVNEGGCIEVDSNNVNPNLTMTYIVKEFKMEV